MDMKAYFWYEVGRYGAIAVLAGSAWLVRKWENRPSARRREAARRAASRARTEELVRRYMN